MYELLSYPARRVSFAGRKEVQQFGFMGASLITELESILFWGMVQRFQKIMLCCCFAAVKCLLSPWNGLPGKSHIPTATICRCIFMISGMKPPEKTGLLLELCTSQDRLLLQPSLAHSLEQPVSPFL